MSGGLPRRPASIIEGRLESPELFSNPKLRRIFEALDGRGEEIRIVGGAIRNALMGEAIADIDLATTALPDIVQQRALDAGLRPVPTGVEHGTITVIADGTPFEVTTLREDVDTFGRHAKVEFGRDFRADAYRRDFTMNALSVDAEGRVYDYCGGLEDIKARRVRFIGDAATRIREDYLRILRLYRFHAAYGHGDIDREAFHAVIALRSGMEQLSRERIRAELMKLLVARNAGAVALEMSDAGILQPILAGIGLAARLSKLADIEAARGCEPDAVLRLAALAVLVESDASRLHDRLRLSNAEATRLAGAAKGLAELHGCTRPPLPNDLFRFLFLHGRRAAMDALLLAHAQSGAAADDAGWSSALAFVRDTPEPRLPFSGGDLLKRGLPHGPAVGATLKRLQAAWIRAGFPREPEVLARLLDEATSE